MAQGYVRGPTHIYCGVGSAALGVNAQPVYLGTAERSPRISIRPSWSPYYNDIAGQKIPYDWGFDGEEGFVVADLTRWNQGVLAALQARPRTLLGGSVPGLNVAGEIGSMMITEGLFVPLWLLFTYTSKAAYLTQPAGYRFAATWLMGPDDLDNNNTGMAKVRMTWYAGRLGVVNVAGAGINWLLYDYNVAGLPAIN